MSCGLDVSDVDYRGSYDMTYSVESTELLEGLHTTTDNCRPYTYLAPDA